MGNEGGKLLDTTTPEGVQAMDENLQRKFSKGIQYNMKVLIRGDRNTGKSCLFRRMQGKPFTESYIPTNEIQVGHIQWTYPCTNDMVKVEIWDVVDQGRSTKKGKDVPLKLSNEADASQDMALDASFLDVYKGAHCVVLMYDITKQWTWQYIERELQHIPLHLPIVVIGNYLDMREHRSVSMEDAEFYVTHLNRPEGAADIRYAESCMKNGYGLRYLHKFLSIPFLQLQQETLLHQLKTNREQIMLVSEGLDSKEDQDYDRFLSDRANPKAPKNRPVPEAPPTNTPPGHTPELPVKSTEKEMVKEPPPPKIPTEESTDGGSIAKKLSSRFTGFLSKSKTKEPTNAPSPKSPPGRPRQKSLGNVDDFVPEGELDDQFFEGGEGGGEEAADDDSDSDEERVNPQVAMDEDLSSLEEEEEAEPPPPPSKPTKKTTPVQPVKSIPASKRIEETESESDEDGVQRPVVALDEDLSSPEEEEEKTNHSTGMLQPTRAPVTVKAIPPAPVKATPPAPRPLKSAREIALTESEEEEEERPVVMMKDEDIPEPVSKVKSGGLLMAHQTQKPKSSGGLLLGHNDSSSPSAPTKEKKKSRKSSSSEKSHKKKRQKSRDGGEEGDKAAGSPVTPAPSDPFDFNSLDAWLGGDDSPSVQPRSTHGLSRALHKSIEENDEEEEEEQRERKKKKKKSDRDAGGDGSIKKKKKNKSKKSETTNIEDLF